MSKGNIEINEILSMYDFDQEQYIGRKIISMGHINTTYVLYFDYGNRVKRYLLQKINTNVFKNPEELMENIESVTNYCRNLLKGFDVPNYHNRTLRVYKTKNGMSFVKTSFDNYYRVYHYVEGGISFNNATDSAVFFNAGKAIGFFQNMLANYPIATLHETIANFHNTPIRYDAFLKALEGASDEVKEHCKDEIEFFKANKDIAYSIQPLLDNGTMPTRVTHNDTKINNIMFDYDTHDALCLIDLDTIMPGSIIYDFGDFVRSGCNMGEEDAQDLSTVIFNDDLFLSFARGYIKAVSSSIQQIELDNLTQGAILMTYEVGLRFLTDYLSGSHYFKISYPEHNLVRCRTQISMVQQIQSKKNVLDNKIEEIYKESL